MFLPRAPGDGRRYVLWAEAWTAGAKTGEAWLGWGPSGRVGRNDTDPVSASITTSSSTEIEVTYRQSAAVEDGPYLELNGYGATLPGNASVRIYAIPMGLR